MFIRIITTIASAIHTAVVIGISGVSICVSSRHQGADGTAIDEDIGAIVHRALLRTTKHVAHDSTAVDGNLRRIGMTHVRPVVPCVGIAGPALNIHIALATAKHVTRAGVNQLLHMIFVFFENGPWGTWILLFVDGKIAI